MSDWRPVRDDEAEPTGRDAAEPTGPADAADAAPSAAGWRPVEVGDRRDPAQAGRPTERARAHSEGHLGWRPVAPDGPAPTQPAPRAVPVGPAVQARPRRTPSIPEPLFWQGRPRSARQPWLLWSALRDHRIGGLLLAMGLFSVFIVQFTPFFGFSLFFQLVLGAPIFEEFLKFGLALSIAAVAAARQPRAWLGVPIVGLIGFVLLFAFAGTPSDWRNEAALLSLYVLGAAGMAALLVAQATGTRPALITARVLLALASGAAFGVMEHNTPAYRAEDDLSFLWRFLFHTVAPGLSMAMYVLLEGASDVRLRWAAVAPAVLVHYLNNAGGLVLVFVVATLTGGAEVAVEFVSRAWSSLLVGALVVWFLASPLLGRPMRRAAERLLAPYLAPVPSAWRAVAPGAGGTPAIRR